MTLRQNPKMVLDGLPDQLSSFSSCVMVIEPIVVPKRLKFFTSQSLKIWDSNASKLRGVDRVN